MRMVLRIFLKLRLFSAFLKVIYISYAFSEQLVMRKCLAWHSKVGWEVQPSLALLGVALPSHDALEELSGSPPASLTESPTAPQSRCPLPLALALSRWACAMSTMGAGQARLRDSSRMWPASLRPKSTVKPACSTKKGKKVAVVVRLHGEVHLLP